MPDYILHIEIGEEILKKVSFNDILNKYYANYILGLQGPDLFFYRAFFPGINGRLSKILGKLLHNEKSSVWSYLALNSLKYLENKDEKDEFFSYFIGFFTHLFTDYYFHPYIKYRTEIEYNHRRLWIHKRFEMDIDCAYVKYKSNNFSPLPYIKKLMILKDFPKNLAKFLAFLLKDAYDISFPICCIASTFHSSYKLMKFVISFAENPGPIRKYIIHPVVFTFLLRGKYINFLTHPKKEVFDDPLNLKHCPWIHPLTKEEFTFSLLDIKEMLINFLRELLPSIYMFIYEDGNYPEILTFNFSFSQGIKVGGNNEKISWIF